MKQVEITLSLTILLLFFSCKVQASPSAPSELLPPPESSVLDSKSFSELSARQRWRVRIHGLRLAPLDSRIWGIRRIDRTDNRNLVPIRPYYLRVSENPKFRCKKIEMEFQFKAAKKRQLLLKRSTMDPVLDIGFAGQYLSGLPGDRAKIDKGHLVRLTAFPLLQSGMFYRSHATFEMLTEGPKDIIKTGVIYRVRIELSSSSAKLFLNDKLYASVQGRNLDQGLISITTSWHPLTINNLEVAGLLLNQQKKVPVRESGLIQIG